MTDSIYKICEQIQLDIKTLYLDEGLQRISKTVEKIFNESSCVAQVFGSKKLDSLCMEIGSKTLTALITQNPDLVEKDESTQKTTFVYLVSRVQNSGGHTKILESFIRLRPDAKHVVLSTELFGSSNKEDFLGRFTAQTDISFETPSIKQWSGVLIWIQSRLLKLKPTHYYLFNHHQDSVLAAAAQPELGNGSFYHHGDHHLCLGVYLKHLTHIDIHPMGFDICRHELGIDNIYVPIFTEDLGKRPDHLDFLSAGHLITCTAARLNKLEQPYPFSYFDLIPDVLEKTKGVHIHIGTLTPWSRLKIYFLLYKKGISFNRFVYIPWVPSLWKALIEHKVDLYIASFPYGGGITMLEAMGAGIPLAIHKHLFSRLLSGYDLTPDSTFCWRYPHELIDYLATLDVTQLKLISESQRKHYLKFYHPSIVEPYFKDNSSSCQQQQSNSSFTPEKDEWGMWMIHRNNWRYLMSKTLITWIKKMRRFIS